MYYTSSLDTILRTALVCSLVTVGLLVVGCDSGGSNGGSNPDWVGNWKENDNSSDVTRAISFSKNEVRVVNARDCNVMTFNVEDVSNGNRVMAGDWGTAKLVVLDNGDMEARNPSNGRVLATYEPADNDKSIEEIAGC